ncbi:hypothetical protein ACMFMG_002714 [Clarireedia jacksonii]
MEKSAYAALWAGSTCSLNPPFTTTASPTPVASSELIYPPPLPGHSLNEDKSLKLPCDFIWGVASSAWQIEGGLQVEGRGPAVFDSIGTESSGFGNDSNIAGMHYFLYKQDMLRLWYHSGRYIGPCRQHGRYF